MARLSALQASLPGARRVPLPAAPRVQLATLADGPPVGPGWLHELKLDGYRMLARIDRAQAELISRNGLDWSAKFPAITQALRKLPVKQALLDGEVVVLLPNGGTSFSALQNAIDTGADPRLTFFAFDLIHLDGWDLSDVPLHGRRARLETLLAAAPAKGPLRFSEHVEGSGSEVLRHVCRLGGEGVISKRQDAPYRPGRSRDWIKSKCVLRQEFVIGGYTDPEGGRSGLGALLLGVYDKARLIYAGRVGTGFTDATLRSLRRRLDKLSRAMSPFANKVTGRSPARAHWVRPELVAEVRFSEWTPDGHLRHPSFEGLRRDKAAREVVRERAA